MYNPTGGSVKFTDLPQHVQDCLHPVVDGELQPCPDCKADSCTFMSEIPRRLGASSATSASTLELGASAMAGADAPALGAFAMAGAEALEREPSDPCCCCGAPACHQVYVGHLGISAHDIDRAMNVSVHGLDIWVDGSGGLPSHALQ